MPLIRRVLIAAILSQLLVLLLNAAVRWVYGLTLLQLLLGLVGGCAASCTPRARPEPL